MENFFLGYILNYKLLTINCMLSFDTPLSAIATIKPITLKKLERLGLLSVRDLLYHFPHRYEDYSVIRPIAEIRENEKCTILGTVTSLQAGHTWKKRMLLTDATLEDASGHVRLIWFNQRFVSQTLKPGMSIRASGKVTRDKKGLLMTNPAFEREARDATHTARLVPVYPETAGLTSKFFRWQLATLFQKIKEFPDGIQSRGRKVPVEDTSLLRGDYVVLRDPMPQEILKRLHLPSLRQALLSVHFPKNPEAALVARKRFAFDEMFFIQLKALQLRLFFQSAQAPAVPLDENIIKDFVSRLPFTLTDAQRKASFEILCDLERNRPMNRLLNGDVGSGKTVVAAMAAVSASHSGFQTALLAPTEVLARQHYESFTRLFAETDSSLALFTASYRILDGETVTRATMLKAIKAGIPRIVIGTHALLQEDVRFHRLGLIVVDEQHRFGVAQRAKLQEAGLAASDGSAETVPHFLAMTATPIPRTLALAFFGDLEVSLLDEMPKSRKPIETKIVSTPKEREKTYAFVREEIEKGRQAFIIFPLVEESLALKDVKAAVVEHTRLAETVFPDLSIGLLHGRLKAEEKEKIMRDFSAKGGSASGGKDGKYDILVATAVVEVGIDIPNASIIIIEEAERFGLAQLHQFRGRVGRGKHQSYCFLFTNSEAASKKLEILAQSQSGFAIADADLSERGPGAFFGTRQSGLPDVELENLMNMKLVTLARDEAKGILKTDPLLKKHPLLHGELEKLDMHLHME